MANFSARASAGRSGPAVAESMPLRIASVGGIVGLALRATTDNPFAPVRISISGYPSSGVWPALAGTAGLALMGLALIAGYTALADRQVAKRAAAVSIGALLALAVAGIGLGFDAALGGSILLAVGLGIAARRNALAVGWIGVAAGAIAIAAAMPAPGLEAARQARDVAVATALSTGFFFVALSAALWRRANPLSMDQQGVDR